MSAVYIYGLKDPRTNEIRYVGKTNNPRRRLEFHLAMKDVNRHKVNWLEDLKRDGAKPVMVILEQTDDKNWGKREKYWIATGRASGWPLTNIADGGANNFYAEANLDAALELYVDKSMLRGLSHEQKLAIAREAARVSVPYAKTARGYEIAKQTIIDQIGENV